MDKIYTMKDTISIDKNDKVMVSDLAEQNGEIFKLIKNGFQFDNEVLEKAHIKKVIRDVHFKNIVVMHEQEKNKQKYVKESESLKTILKSLNTLENHTNEMFESQTNDINEEIDTAFLENDE